MPKLPERRRRIEMAELTCLLLLLPLFIPLVHTKNCQIMCTNEFEEPGANCTACQCKKGFYTNVGLKLLNLPACERCLTNCSEPTVLVGKCFGSTSTRCEPCPEGTFYKAFECILCTNCPQGIVSNCTSNTDTECGNYTTKITTKIMWRTRGKISSGMKWLWLGIGITIGVFLSMIAFLVWKCCHNRAEKSALATESGSNLLIQAGTPYHQSMHFELTEEERAMPIRELAGSCIDELALLLNPSGNNNWRRLGGIFKYTLNDLAGFENEFRFTQNLLWAWGTTNVATVGALLNALRKIGRDDAFGVLSLFIIDERRVDRESAIIPFHGNVSEASLTDSASDASCMTQLIRCNESVSVISETSI